MNLGGPFQGYMAPPSNTFTDNNDVIGTRFILRNAWNNNYLGSNIKAACTPFRAVNNSGDLLSRQNYSCGGPCQTYQSRPNLHGLKSGFGHIQNMCDGSNIPPAACNTKYVADTSDYTRFLKQKAVNKNYNDRSFGGDDNNASQSAIRAIRRY